MSSSEQVYRAGAGPQVTGRPAGAAAASVEGGAVGTATAPPAGAVPAPSGAPIRPAGPPANGAGTRPVARPVAPSEPQQAAPAAAAGPRKVRLTVARVDPWSVLKLSFLLSVALGIVLVTASVVLWAVLDAMGVFAALNNELRTIGSANSRFDINQWVGLGRVVSLTTVLAVVNVVIIMALSTLAAVLYNIASTLVGGLQVTLSDD